MILTLHQIAALFYLVASLAASYGIGMGHLRARRFGVGALGAGFLVHTLALGFLHQEPTPPPLSDLPPAISIMVWISVLFFLLMRLRMRISGLVVFVAPPAFIGTTYAALYFPVASEVVAKQEVWSHLHILLSSGGFALLALAAGAGTVFLVANRVLKDRRPKARRLELPSLEALDRLNLISLSVGFPLLTLGLITGILWSRVGEAELAKHAPHVISSTIAWGVYVGLLIARLGVGKGYRQPPMQAAKSAIVGFVILFVAIVIVGILK